MIITGVAISVAAVLVVGLLVARKVDGDSTNFLVAGRSLMLPLSAAGLMGQAVDSNATLGNTDLSYGFGFWAGASLPLGLGLCLLVTGLFFARRMNAMQLHTLPDFYRITYGRTVEVLASILMIFSFCILLAGNLVAGGLLFETFLGTSYEVGILLIVAVVLAYTVTGGMFSDAYTAFIQMCITTVASTSLLIWVAVRFGISTPDGMGPFDLGQLTDPGQGAMINWGTLLALGIGDVVAIDFMQRIFSARSPDTARRACFVGAAGTALVGIPYALVALSSVRVFGDETVDGPALFHLLADYAPTGLAVLVLCGIVAASCSTANGAILGTAAVAVRNVADYKRDPDPDRRDPMLRLVRLTMFPVVGVAVLFAVRVPETGILLTLAFDVMLACLVVPFIAGHYGPRRNHQAALVAIVVGFVVRVGLFVLTPTIFGADNTLLYVHNDVIGPGFDGWPTIIGFAASAVAFYAATLVWPSRPVPVMDAQEVAAAAAALRTRDPAGA
ncbi:sodium:solute symporter family protein [Mangrovihabitans endophyticus]|uniref:Sodium:solute symporter n=1 Tax=Mangrovihabitans endophyticus TaxID=1751298 RepID=A0A8J3BWV9_9ACTN|nr:sodium:solute symporter family protein [Mangrovihabitans endophyticus]GGK78069.1 sodium:solute symporter [Mangrovihabitans endophyticus]